MLAKFRENFEAIYHYENYHGTASDIAEEGKRELSGQLPPDETQSVEMTPTATKSVTK